MAKGRWGRNPATGKPIFVPDKKPKAAVKATPVAKQKAPLRGVALVEAALATKAKDEQLTGMSERQISGIDFAGKPLSPGLQRWLAADADMFTLGSPESLTEMLDRELDEWASSFVDLGRYLTEPVVLFEGWGADSRRFLYLGATDEHGEYPVFTIDIDDTPFACLNGPVDVWLAQHAGHLAEEEYYGFVPKAYEPARKALATKCFGGYIAHLDGQFSTKLS